MKTGAEAPRAKKFSEIRRPETPERRARIDAIKTRMDASERLFEVRKELGITQAAVAGRLGVSQGNVSEIERREDALLSTVRAYVEALGGELALVGVFGEQRITIDLRSFAGLTDDDAADLNAADLGPVEGRIEDLQAATPA